MKATTGPISADYKVPGGKLLRVRLELGRTDDPPRIATLRLCGDFFMHPEEAIEALEDRLVGVVWAEGPLRAAVQAFFDSGVEVLGADVADIVHAIMMAR